MPITPVFEQPPVKKGIDWQPTIDALAAKPGEWARVDGPWPAEKAGAVSSRLKSFRAWAKKAGLKVEAQSAAKDGERWMYARVIVAQAEPEPAPKAEAKPARPVTAVPDPELDDDEVDGHKCDLCGDVFKSNSRLRQHQAMIHKAS